MIKNNVRKYIPRFLATLVAAVFIIPSGAGAVSVADLQSQLQALNAQLSQLQNQQGTSTVPSSCVGLTLSRNLKIGSVGQDVKCLQQLLNQDSQTQIAATGPGSPGNETMVFGPATKGAVVKFQQKYASQILTPAGLAGGTGIVGYLTLSKLNFLIMSKAQAPAPPAPPMAPMPPVPPALSQSDITMAAISKAVPAVVSVVITKNVMQYEVVYENPFGNDPFFGNSGFLVPVYRPTGRTVSQKVGAGSGFLISQEGFILTNKHVVSDVSATYTITLASGAEHAAYVIYKDAQNDIAIIKIDGSNYPVLSLGDSSSLQLGQPIIAIGNALGQYNNSVSLGIVSGLNRNIQASDSTGAVETLDGVIQTDAAINPGNSGGPLLDLQGKVVGINVAVVQGSSNISFSLPINPIKIIVKSVLGF